ncbi:MAG: InlB B-repeat-containing protein [Treponema sp.]|nr:InlB B-repeat-containing protein [Treponema sp.]
MESRIVAANGNVQEPDEPTRNNYVFDAWYKEAAAANVWDFDSDTVTAPTTLYAGWTPVWTVTFNARQGSAVDPITGVINGELIAKPMADPERAGFSFGGWHKEAVGTNAWDFDTDTVTGNTTLYARWTVTVAFNANGGSAAPANRTLTRGSLVAEPETEPVNAGKTFMGWHREAAGTTEWNFGADTASVHTTLYAKWAFVPVKGIVNAPMDGILRAPDLGVLDLGAAVVDPPNASVKTIGWTLKSAGTTGAVLAGNKVTVTAIGTVTLTAIVTGGIASGNYAEDFVIPVTTIRKVTGIGGSV